MQIFHCRFMKVVFKTKVMFTSTFNITFLNLVKIDIFCHYNRLFLLVASIEKPFHFTYYSYDK